MARFLKQMFQIGKEKTDKLIQILATPNGLTKPQLINKLPEVPVKKLELTITSLIYQEEVVYRNKPNTLDVYYALKVAASPKYNWKTEDKGGNAKYNKRKYHDTKS